MESEQKDFLIAEFNKAWDMVLAIDSRRGTFSRYYNVLFLAVLTISTHILVRIDRLNIVICVGLSLVFIFTYVAGETIKGILKSERNANIRYRKKINLIREVFCGDSEDDLINLYLSHKDLGILLISQDSEQPKGIGRTLAGIFKLIRIQKATLILCTLGLWSYYFIKRFW